MNNNYRKPLQGTQLDFYDVRQAVEDIQPGAYAKLPYTSKVLAEQLVRRCDPTILEQSLKQLIERKQERQILQIKLESVGVLVDDPEIERPILETHVDES